MKHSLYLTAAFFLCFLPIGLPANAAPRPRVTVIATGGTIAGSAASSTQAGYTPAQLSVQALLDQVPSLEEKADVTGYQLCNIASQNITLAHWLRLAVVIDSLFTNDAADGVVVTHGTDTMEETAYFLHLVIPHDNPVVLTGAMRPSTGIGADGPANLFDAVSLAGHPLARGKGVMVVMNNTIFSADDVTKTHTVHTNAFECPNYGPLGVMRGGEPTFFRASVGLHTTTSVFSIRAFMGAGDAVPVTKGRPSEVAARLPRVEVVMSYAGTDAWAVDALLSQGVEGIVITGVGHGNYAQSMQEALQVALHRGVAVVRCSRVLRGGVTTELEDWVDGQVAGYFKSPQKARILLMLGLSKTNNKAVLQQFFTKY